ncbi:MAG: phosphatase PAP2 family protein [Aquificaceae bacterium]|nr:phosphatase PAP2 family protein [Aquificaceae bacterium]
MDVENFALNRGLFYFINQKRHPLLDVFYKYFYLFGKGWFGFFVGALLLLTGSKLFLKYLLTMTLQTLVVKLLKYTVRAKRPSHVFDDVYLLERLKLKSFPSGDTAMSTSIALCLFESSQTWLKPLLFLYPVLIGYGRVYMGAHFPLDVFTGWVIGVLCFIVISILL